MNPIDKKIREKFQNHQPAVDTDALWKEVYPSIKKKRKPYLGFLLIAVLSISATSFFWYINTNNQTISSNIAVQKEISLTNNADDKQTTQANETIERETKALEENVIQASAGKAQVQAQAQIQPQIQKQTNSSLFKSTYKKSIQKNQLAPFANRDILKNEKVKLIQDRSAELSTINNNSATKKSINEEVIPNSLFKEAIKTETLIGKISDPIIKKQPRQIFKSIQLQNENKNLIFDESLLDNIPVASFEEDKTDWFVSPSFGLFLTSRKLQMNEATATEETFRRVAERNEKESQLESSFTELAFGRVLTNNWGVSFGVNYRETNELSENAVQKLDTVLKDDILIEIRNMPNGMQEEIYGSAQVPQTIISQEGRYNKYQSVSAFADVFYRIQTKKIIWQAELGLQQSAWFKAIGHIIDSENSFYDLQEDNEKILANTGGLSIRTGLGVIVPVTNKWSIYAKSRFIKDFNSVLSKENEITQKYQILGISAGAQLAF